MLTDRVFYDTRRCPIDNVLLLDVDNTLLDNDRFEADLTAQLERAFGRQGRDQFWRGYEKLRAELDYADYLGAVQRFRGDVGANPQLLLLGSWLLSYPFAERLFPGTLDLLNYLRRFGPPVLLSDGDVVFQPHKIRRAGLWDAVDGRVLIYVHKEHMLDTVEARFPAQHYVMVDDKPHVLASMKQIMGDRLTTVFVRQGHYAHAPGTPHNAADVTIQRIADLRHLDLRTPQLADAHADAP
ncbi:MAG TPA: HAD family hydrolase [Gammaproteobacteria bacterium]|nr:HAD family hydrolase [Gammaproteobacteria bacterium]